MYQKRISKIIIIFSMIAFIPIMWIAFYTHPSADDYNYSELYTQAVMDNDGGVIELLKAAYQTMMDFQNSWQGTYSAAFLNSLQPGIYGTHEEYYAITPYIICVSLFIALYLFLKELRLTLHFPTKYNFPLTLAVLLTIIEGFPSPVQGLFWYTGCMTYMFFFSLALLQVAIFLSFNHTSKHATIKCLFCIVNAFIVAGGNHITAFLTILVSAGFVCYAIIVKKKKTLISYLLCMLTSIIGFIIVMTAPGTAVRANTLERQTVLKTMLVSIFDTFGDISNYFNLPLMLLLLITLLLSGYHIIHNDNYHLFRFRYAALCFILSFGLYCASICVPYYAMGGAGAGRVSDMRYALLVVLTVLNFIYLYGCILSAVYSHPQATEHANELISILKQFRSDLLRRIIIPAITVISMFVIVFFSYRTSVTTNCAIELINGEAAGFHEQKLDYIHTDLNDPVYIPRMIYYNSGMSDA